MKIASLLLLVALVLTVPSVADPAAPAVTIDFRQTDDSAVWHTWPDGKAAVDSPAGDAATPRLALAGWSECYLPIDPIALDQAGDVVELTATIGFAQHDSNGDGDPARSTQAAIGLLQLAAALEPGERASVAHGVSAVLQQYDSAGETVYSDQLRGHGPGAAGQVLASEPARAHGTGLFTVTYRLKRLGQDRLELRYRDSRGTQLQAELDDAGLLQADCIYLFKNTHSALWVESLTVRKNPPSAEAGIQVPALSGLRQTVSLNGPWQFVPVMDADVPDEDALPPADAWDGPPVMVPSTYSRTSEYGYPSDWSKAEHAWHRLPFYLPAATDAPPRLTVHFQAVAHIARVYLNGHLLATHEGGYLPFTVELSEHARWGERNDLVVLALGMDAVWERDDAGNILETGISGRQRYFARFPYGTGHDVNGIYDDVSLQLLPQSYLRRPRIHGSLAAGELAIQATVDSPSGLPAGSELRFSVERDGETVRSFEPHRFETAPAAGLVDLDLTRAWPDPRPWSPADPVLYQLHTQLVVDGAVVDERRDRFGVRDITVRGSDVLLNGAPLRVIGTAYERGYGPDLLLNPSFFRSFVIMAKAAGFNQIRSHRAPMLPSQLAICDELGMLVESEAPIFNNAAKSLQRETYRENAKTFIREWLARDANHPSLIIYSTANEHVISSAKRPHLLELVETAVAADPTRLIVSQGDAALDGTAPIYCPHYTMSNTAAYDVAEKPSFLWDRQEQWQGDRPYYLGEMAHYEGYLPERSSLFIGEDAFRDVFKPAAGAAGQYGGQLSPALNAGMAHAVAADLRNFRVEGRIFGINLFSWNRKAIAPIPERFSLPDWSDPSGPGVKPTAVAPNKPGPDIRLDLNKPAGQNFQTTGMFDATRLNAAPICSMWHDQLFTVAAGGEWRNTLHVFNDSFAPQTLTVEWRLGDVAAGSWTQDMATGERSRHELRATLPAFDARTELTLTARLLATDGTVLHERHETVTALPPADLDRLADTWLFDPAGVAAAIPAQPFTALDAIPPGGLLILAPGSVADPAFQPIAAGLQAYIVSGGRVLVLRQDTPPGWLPYPITIDSRRVPRAFLTPYGQSLLPDMTDGDLALWGERNGTGHLLTDQAYRLTPGGPVHKLAVGRGPNGLDAVVLAQIPHGAGQVLLCQVDLVANLERTPAAGRLLLGLVDLLRAAPTTEPQALWSNLPTTGLSEFHDVYADAIQRDTAFPLGGPDGPDTALVSFSDDSGARPSAAAMAAFVEAGGTLWLHDMQPADLAELGQLIPPDLKLLQAQTQHPQLEPTAAARREFPILTTSDLWWNTGGKYVSKEPMITHGWRLSADSDATVLAQEPRYTTRDPGWKIGWGRPQVIDDPLAGVLMVRRGAGVILLDQTRWHVLGRLRPDALQLPVAILQRAGVRAADPTGIKPPLFAANGHAVSPVDISAVANMAFADETAGDGKGGWTDQGENDLRDMPLGDQHFASIPFHILDPATNDGKACLVMSQRRGAALPKTVTIPIDRPCRRLYILHTLAWSPSSGKEAWSFVARNRLQAETRQPMLVGYDTANWWKRGVEPIRAYTMPSAATKRVPVDNRRVQRNLFVTCWENPAPTEAITSITITVEDPDCVPIILGISIEE